MSLPLAGAAGAARRVVVSAPWEARTGLRPPTDRSEPGGRALPLSWAITQAEGTAMVISAERLGGVRRRERDPARDA
ncbi:hypothetical protein, partial [Streptomyces massasporeus]|uniref:hypothetical protein n=1 Tax=Streptomyces massasporeus TaxID=67324 RepID=UPI00332D0CB2